jgi:hypothetical protein
MDGACVKYACNNIQGVYEQPEQMYIALLLKSRQTCCYKCQKQIIQSAVYVRKQLSDV